jgi:hypothetical protein
MRRDGDMHDSPALVREEDEHEEHAIRGSWNDEQIGGHDLPDMIGQEGPPRLGRRFGGAGEVLCDGGLTDLHAELQQLAVDAWRPTTDSPAPPSESAREHSARRAVDRRVDDESSTSRTGGIPCDARRRRYRASR